MADIRHVHLFKLVAFGEYLFTRCNEPDKKMEFEQMYTEIMAILVQQAGGKVTRLFNDDIPLDTPLCNEVIQRYLDMMSIVQGIRSGYPGISRATRKLDRPPPEYLPKPS